MLKFIEDGIKDVIKKSVAGRVRGVKGNSSREGGCTQYAPFAVDKSQGKKAPITLFS